MLRLVAYAPNGVRRYPISTSSLVIGSGEGCGLRLEGDAVLDQHCIIEANGKVVQLVAVQPEHPQGQITVDGQSCNLMVLDPRSDWFKEQFKVTLRSWEGDPDEEGSSDDDPPAGE